MTFPTGKHSAFPATGKKLDESKTRDCELNLLFQAIKNPQFIWQTKTPKKHFVSEKK